MQRGPREWLDPSSIRGVQTAVTAHHCNTHCELLDPSSILGHTHSWVPRQVLGRLGARLGLVVCRHNVCCSGVQTQCVLQWCADTRCRDVHTQCAPNLQQSATICNNLQQSATICRPNNPRAQTPIPKTLNPKAM